MEFATLFPPMARYIVLFVIAVLGAAGIYAHSIAAPGCDSEQAQNKVYDILHDRFHLNSIFINNVRTLSGGWFSDSHDCLAQVVEIRGNVSASDMPWRELRFHVMREEAAHPMTVTVNVGGPVPLAEPPPSLWERLFAWL